MPQELYIFAHVEHARAAGFRDGKHQGHPDMRCWCVKNHEPDRLRGMVLSRVYVTNYTPRWVAEYGSDRDRENLECGLQAARSMLREAPMLWMDL